MSDRCYYIKHGKAWVFIPCCMGGAARGPEHCTCLTMEEKVNALTKRLELMAVRLEAAEAWINQHLEPGEPHPVVAQVNERIKRLNAKPLAITQESPHARP